MYFKLFIFVLAAVFINGGCLDKNAGVTKESVNQAQENPEKSEIKWLTNLSEGLKAAQDTKKPLMVDFYADWCGWCKKLDKDVYPNPEVLKLAEKFICVKVDTDANKADADKYQISSLPTIVFLKPDGQVIEKIIGYRDSKDFIKIMSGIKGL